MEQKQARPLTPEEQAEAQKQSVIWQRECFQNAQSI